MEWKIERTESLGTRTISSPWKTQTSGHYFAPEWNEWWLQKKICQSPYHQNMYGTLYRGRVFANAIKLGCGHQDWTQPKKWHPGKLRCTEREGDPDTHSRKWSCKDRGRDHLGHQDLEEAGKPPAPTQNLWRECGPAPTLVLGQYISAD